KDFDCLTIKKERYVPVDPAHPVAVLWETRASRGGNTVMCRIDFYGENRETVRGEYQFRSSVDPTQPTLFQRNAHLASARMPAKTKFLRLSFHHCPKESDEFPGEVANVRVVDLVGEVGAVLAKQKDTLAARAAAGEEDVLAYVSDNLTDSFPVMPESAAVPGKAGDTLKVRECAGEKTRATVVLWSKRAHWPVTVEFTDLKRGPLGFGGTIPASALRAKIVKAHYQAEGTPGGFLALSDKQVLIPELLLNDDSLVVPDHNGNRNLVKCQADGTSWYVDVNTLGHMPWAFRMPVSQMPITDAKTLLPFGLEAGLNKQIMIRLAVPKNAMPGVYKGKILFRSGSSGQATVIASVPLELEVLPFELPAAAETVYDPKREYTMGLYTWACPYADGTEAYYSPMARSREQALNEWKTLVDNGVTYPAFIWSGGIVFNDAKFREHLALAREAGFPGKVLHLGASGHIGNATDSAALEKKKAELKRAMDVAKEFGYDDVYFYGFDEAKGDRLLSQITAWKAAHEVGAKVMVSGYSQHFKLVGDYLDLCVYADDAGSANPAQWHSKGARLWKYNTPQTGPEDPGIFRRNYGLDIWKRGFDGANTYCDVGSSACWNDVAGVQKLSATKKAGTAYRSLCIVYPTTDGVIETLALTGLESAIKDVRYMTKFRQLLRAKPNAAAQAWFDGLKPETDDLAKTRRETIDWILRLR
ncbi:MAG: hypothetical protein PHV28_13600, partial [Kiritimatiellae bacterium]|nr:hypothetical protein [Kiritimatiellia bacterium]